MSALCLGERTPGANEGNFDVSRSRSQAIHAGARHARGAAFRAEEEFVDRSALLVLDQQIRDAAAGIERAKRALAVAIAQDEAEGKRLETTLTRITNSLTTSATT